jgi:hypothetical protein
VVDGGGQVEGLLTLGLVEKLLSDEAAAAQPGVSQAAAQLGGS